MASAKVLTVVGARPQFIKAAAVSRAFRSFTDIEEKLVHTGQHYDANMSDVFFEGLGIPAPSHRLNLGQLSHGQMTGRMIEALETIFIEEQPDAVLIYGDTNSTLAGAISAVKIHIPVIHIEAGVRSFNRQMPEEINRIIADQISSMCLCPTHIAAAHLRNEGITENVHVVGDVMHDATLYAIEKTKDDTSFLKKLGLEGEDYAICTLHRAENTDDPDRFERLIDFVEAQAKTQKVIFPVHPRTRNVMTQRGIVPSGVTLIDPLDYFELAALLANCALIMTDSGGLQKEAYYHRKPCITLRDETEWVQTIETGWNRLWTQPDWHGARGLIQDYGFGDAAEKSVKRISQFLTGY